MVSVNKIYNTQSTTPATAGNNPTVNTATNELISFPNNKQIQQNFCQKYQLTEEQLQQIETNYPNLQTLSEDKVFEIIEKFKIQELDKKLCEKYNITPEVYNGVFIQHPDFRELEEPEQRRIIEELTKATNLNLHKRRPENTTNKELKENYVNASKEEKRQILAIEIARNQFIASGHSAEEWNNLSDTEMDKKIEDADKLIPKDDKGIEDEYDELFLFTQIANTEEIDAIELYKNRYSTENRNKVTDLTFDYLIEITGSCDARELIDNIWKNESGLITESDEKFVDRYITSFSALEYYLEQHKNEYFTTDGNGNKISLYDKFKGENPCPSSILGYYKLIDNKSIANINFEYLQHLKDTNGEFGMTKGQKKELATLNKLKDYFVDEKDVDDNGRIAEIKNQIDIDSIKGLENKANAIIEYIENTYSDLTPQERFKIMQETITGLSRELNTHLAVELHKQYQAKYPNEYTDFLKNGGGSGMDATIDALHSADGTYNKNTVVDVALAHTEGNNTAHIRATQKGIGKRKDAQEIRNITNRLVAESEKASNEAKQAYAQYSVEYSRPEYRQAQMDDLKTYNNEYFNKGAETGYQNAIQNERANNTQNSHETVPTQNIVETKTYSTDVISSSSVTVSPAEQKQVRQTTRQIEHEIDQNTMLAAQDKEQLKREARKVGGDPQKLVAFISTNGQKFSKILGKMPSVTRRNIIKTFCKSADRAQILNFLKQNPSFADDIIGAGGYKIKGDVSAFLILNKQHTAPLSQNLIALGLTPKQVLPSVEKGSDMYMNLLALSQKDPKTEEQTRNEPPVYTQTQRQYRPSFERKF